MIVKVWNEMQVRNLYDLKEKYQIPMKVIAEVGHIVKRLDGAYGSERDVENDDGGYYCCYCQTMIQVVMGLCITGC